MLEEVSLKLVSDGVAESNILNELENDGVGEIKAQVSSKCKTAVANNCNSKGYCVLINKWKKNKSIPFKSTFSMGKREISLAPLQLKEAWALKLFETPKD